MPKTILTYNSPHEFETAAAVEIVRSIGAAIAERHVCTWALAGGETPQGIYRMLGNEPYKHQIEWAKIHLFFGDERMVPPGDPQSNFGMAHHSLLSHVPVLADHIHRIHGEMQPPDAASMYARELSTYIPDLTFDLMLLGLGDDGHTASLFPGTAIVDDTEETVGAVFVPHLNAWRVSLTLPVINRSRQILFLVSGRSKAPVMKRLVSSGTPSKDMPASLVRPVSGSLLFMCDSEAASEMARGTIA